jgi:flavin reductase (DIM6/NTAB) family NADH-FMN oxidoreductase RutF
VSSGEVDGGIDPATFRRAVGRFATGVCVVTTRHRQIDHAMTANAFTSVSIDPMLVLFCVDTGSRFHDAVQASGSWAVSVLTAQARPIAQWLSTPGRPLAGQLDTVPHRYGRATGAALIDAASSWLECETDATHPGGDHTIVVGRVVSLDIDESSASALLYHRSAYASVLT